MSDKSKSKKTLVIVESPAKAKKIGGFLGSNYEVLASVGHIRDLPQKAADVTAEMKALGWTALGVNVEQDFAPLYLVPAEKKKTIAELKRALKGADELILATDEDREGESIGWHLADLLQPKVPVKRMVFSEITKPAILDALKHTRDLDMNLVRAQETRRVLDRLYGYTLSPLLWKKVAPKLSAGRVQSVAVRVMVSRELERLAFKISEYWDVEANVSPLEPEQEAEAQAAFKVKLVRQRESVSSEWKSIAAGKDFDDATGELKSQSKAVHLLEADAVRIATETGDLGQKWIANEPEQKPGRRKAPPPFTTSTLQQAANGWLKLSARQTMTAAQRLYEEGHITYMRTDSTSLSQEALSAARHAVESRYGVDSETGKVFYSGPRQFASKTKNAQEAHEAIRPAGDNWETAKEKGLGGVEASLYDLIWQRAVASQMADHEYLTTTYSVECGNYEYQTSGTVDTFLGFERAYSVEGTKRDATTLPDIHKGERLFLYPADPPIDWSVRKPQIEALKATREGKQAATILMPNPNPLQHFTQPPARYTEATLVKKLEAEGVGRPSTYASIISTVQDRGYVTKDSNQLIPTFKAFAVSKLLEEYFPKLVDLQFTAQMEQSLDDISNGVQEYLPYLRAFYSGEQGLEATVKHQEANIDPKKACSVEIAGLNATVRIGRYGPYLQRIEGDVTLTAPLPEDVSPDDINNEMADKLFEAKARGPEALGMHPDEGVPVFSLTGRFGPYVQLGEVSDENPKPKRSSIPKGTDPASVTLDLALKLLSMPRNLGPHPEDGKPVNAGLGRFGPYVEHNRKFKSLQKTDDVLTIGLERGLELLAMARVKAGAEPIRDLGKHPEDDEPVGIYDGKYGHYVKHGSVNATIPKGSDIATFTLEEAIPLLAERAAAGGGKKPTRKKAAAKKTTKSATKKAASKKKAVKKKAAKKVAEAE